VELAISPFAISKQSFVRLLTGPFTFLATLGKHFCLVKMAPKKDLDPDLKKGDVVQAVVIADPFNTKFGPLTTPTTPKVRFPK
jgi:hypothetical protein